MKIAIVQPYIFPYIGYFQLINEVDTFVFYDDVNFIKKGWIHRNNLLINGSKNLFSIPLIKSSQNKLINEIEVAIDQNWLSGFLKKIELAYKKAPNYDKVVELIKNTLTVEKTFISTLAIKSVILISEYLEMNTEFKISSQNFSDSRGLEKANRLIEITKKLGGDTYVNPIGGTELYDKDYFSSQHIKLQFIKPQIDTYKQFENQFIEGLSIIDILMFNSKEESKKLISNYSII